MGRAPGLVPYGGDKIRNRASSQRPASSRSLDDWSEEKPPQGAVQSRGRSTARMTDCRSVDRGSTPRRETNVGLWCQWEHGCSARSESQFESVWVHQDHWSIAQTDRARPSEGRGSRVRVPLDQPWREPGTDEDVVSKTIAGEEPVWSSILHLSATRMPVAQHGQSVGLRSRRSAVQVRPGIPSNAATVESMCTNMSG